MPTSGITISRQSTGNYLNVNTTISSSNGTITEESIYVSGGSGRLRATGSAGIRITDCLIQCASNTSGSGDNSAVLTYGSRQGSNVFSLERCSVLVHGAPRRNLLLSEITDTLIRMSGTARALFVYTQSGAELENVTMTGCSTWEIYRAPAKAANVRMIDCANGPLNWEAGVVDLVGLDLIDFPTASSHYWLGGGNSGQNTYLSWNPGSSIDWRKSFFQSSNSRLVEGYTAFLELRDSTGPVSGAAMIYRDDRATTGTQAVIGRYTTGSDGRLEGVHNSRTGTDAATSTDRPVLFIRTNLVAGTNSSSDGIAPHANAPSGAKRLVQSIVTPQLQVKSYEHLPLAGYGDNDDYSITAPVGLVDSAAAPLSPVGIGLEQDPAISETKTTVDAWTTLETASKLYHRMVSHWRDNDSVPRPSISGSTINVGAANVTLAATGATVIGYASGAWTIVTGATFAGNIVTTGAVTVPSTVTLTGFIRDSSGASGLITVNGTESEQIALFTATGDKLFNAALGASGTVAIPLTATQTADGLRLVQARSGYGHTIQTIDFADGGELTLNLSPLPQHTLPDGREMLGVAANSTEAAIVTASYILTDLTMVELKIDIADLAVNVGPIYDTVAASLITDDGMKYLGFGGKQILIDINPTAGNSLFLAATTQLRRTTAGDGNSGVVGNVFHPASTPVDDVNGGVSVSGGVNLDQLSTAIGRALLDDLDLDPSTLGVQSMAAIVLNIQEFSRYAMTQTQPAP